MLIQKRGVNWGVLGVVKVSSGSLSCRFLDLALCGQTWTTNADQPEARKSSEEQKEKAPRKGAVVGPS